LPPAAAAFDFAIFWLAAVVGEFVYRWLALGDLPGFAAVDGGLVGGRCSCCWPNSLDFTACRRCWRRSPACRA
jgi:hypothetical protein